MKNPIMTHLVCGYPSIKKSQELLEILSKHSKYVEIQIPFSDPIADGPVITDANEKALKNGVTPTICFNFLEKFMKENTTHYPLPTANLLIMTYYNIVYNYGVEKFVKKAKSIGIYGFIIPDMPFDEKEGIELIALCKKYDINLIQVISPTYEKSRLKKIFSISSGFVYAVSQNMTTGNKITVGANFEKYIKDLKKLKDIEIGVGFGVKTSEDINNVCKVADFAVIGSKLIRILNQNGTEGVKQYFEGF